MKTTTKILIGILIISLILVYGCEKQLTPPPLPDEGEGAEETQPEQETAEQGEIPSPPPLPGG